MERDDRNYVYKVCIDIECDIMEYLQGLRTFMRIVHENNLKVIVDIKVSEVDEVNE